MTVASWVVRLVDLKDATKGAWMDALTGERLADAKEG